MSGLTHGPNDPQDQDDRPPAGPSDDDAPDTSAAEEQGNLPDDTDQG